MTPTWLVVFLAFLLGHEDYDVRERTTRLIAACDRWVVLTPYLDELAREGENSFEIEVRRRAARARFAGSRPDNWKALGRFLLGRPPHTPPPLGGGSVGAAKRGVPEP